MDGVSFRAGDSSHSSSRATGAHLAYGRRGSALSATKRDRDVTPEARAMVQALSPFWLHGSSSLICFSVLRLRGYIPSHSGPTSPNGMCDHWNPLARFRAQPHTKKLSE